MTKKYTFYKFKKYEFLYDEHEFLDDKINII